jgi:hypothetical protein
MLNYCKNTQRESFFSRYYILTKSRISWHFMELLRSLRCSQEPGSSPHHQTDESSAQFKRELGNRRRRWDDNIKVGSLRINFNIIISSTPRVSKFSLSFYVHLFCPSRVTCPALLTLFDFLNLIKSGERAQEKIMKLFLTQYTPDSTCLLPLISKYFSAPNIHEYPQHAFSSQHERCCVKRLNRHVKLQLCAFLSLWNNSNEIYS